VPNFWSHSRGAVQLATFEKCNLYRLSGLSEKQQVKLTTQGCFYAKSYEELFAHFMAIYHCEEHLIVKQWKWVSHYLPLLLLNLRKEFQGNQDGWMHDLERLLWDCRMEQRKELDKNSP
jgi:hypothetical protein